MTTQTPITSSSTTTTTTGSSSTTPNQRYRRYGNGGLGAYFNNMMPEEVNKTIGELFAYFRMQPESLNNVENATQIAQYWLDNILLKGNIRNRAKLLLSTCYVFAIHCSSTNIGEIKQEIVKLFCKEIKTFGDLAEILGLISSIVRNNDFEIQVKPKLEILLSNLALFGGNEFFCESLSLDLKPAFKSFLDQIHLTTPKNFGERCKQLIQELRTLSTSQSTTITSPCSTVASPMVTTVPTSSSIVPPRAAVSIISATSSSGGASSSSTLWATTGPRNNNEGNTCPQQSSTQSSGLSK